MPASLTAQTKKTNDRAASTGQANPPENTMAWYRRQAIVKTPAQPLPNPIQPSPTLAVPPLGPVLLKKQSRIIKLIGNFNKAEWQLYKAEYAAFESRSRASRRGAGKEEPGKKRQKMDGMKGDYSTPESILNMDPEVVDEDFVNSLKYLSDVDELQQETQATTHFEQQERFLHKLIDDEAKIDSYEVQVCTQQQKTSASQWACKVLRARLTAAGHEVPNAYTIRHALREATAANASGGTNS
jgi:hypothetical protein